MQHLHSGWGSAPDPDGGGAYSALPYPLLVVGVSCHALALISPCPLLNPGSAPEYGTRSASVPRISVLQKIHSSFPVILSQKCRHCWIFFFFCFWALCLTTFQLLPTFPPPPPPPPHALFNSILRRCIIMYNRL